MYTLFLILKKRGVPTLIAEIRHYTNDPYYYYYYYTIDKFYTFCYLFSTVHKNLFQVYYMYLGWRDGGGGRR